MGGIRKIRKKYSRPSHPWQGARIESENVLVKKYGLVKKKELWKMGAILKNFKDQSKRLSTLTGDQAEKEKYQLFTKLKSIGLLKEGESSDAILGLTLENVLDRRLQTIVFKKGLAKSMKQSRQFILHGHISVNSRRLTVPSFLVPAAMENTISFSAKSSLYSIDNPERIKEETPKDRIVVQEKKEESKEEKHERKEHKERKEYKKRAYKEHKGK
jgi:small subunit ribosomal protein S4